MRISLVFAALLVLAGCTTFHGLKALDPGPGNPMTPPLIDDPRPTLRWEAATEPGTTYDLVVYQGVTADQRTLPGRIVYRREALEGTEHRLEEPLNAECDYFWTVRTRRGPEVGEWARYDYFLFLGLGYRSVKNSLYRFYLVAERKPNRPL